MSFPRKVEPELLDAMSPEDPRAVRARRDLQRVNELMGHMQIWKRALHKAISPSRVPKHIVELGVGDASLLLKLAPALAVYWPNVTLHLVDRQPVVDPRTLDAFEALGWQAMVITADIRDWMNSMPPADLTVANLFLHHFGDIELSGILHQVARMTEIFVACEPRRSSLALLASYLVGLVGCGAVTRYDAVVSVRAGFCGNELSALWPDDVGWNLYEAGAGLFSHVLMTRRTSAVRSALQ